MNPLRILVTDAHELAGLGAIRSLGQAGHTVVAAYPQDQKQPACVWSRFCSDKINYPNPWSFQVEFGDWIREQGNRGAFDAVLPITEASIAGVASVRKKLPDQFLPIMPSDSVLKFTLSRYFSTQMALSIGMLCPETVFVSDGTPNKEWNEDISKLHFPIVIKTDNHLTSEGIYAKGHTYEASNPDEAVDILDKLKEFETSIIAQELIPGKGLGTDLLRFGGRTLLQFAHQRLHEIPYTGGYSSFRESCRND